MTGKIHLESWQHRQLEWTVSMFYDLRQSGIMEGNVSESVSDGKGNLQR